MALLQKLLPEGWDPPPFTHFKHIISDSNVGPEILELAQSLLQPGASLVTCQQALKNLKKLAHAFNFIDCVFHYKTEEAQKISQENLAIKILCANGIFTKLENVPERHAPSTRRATGSIASASPTVPTTLPAHCPMAPSAGWKSRARCAPIRCCFASTSRPPASIITRAPHSTNSCARCATSTAPRSFSSSTTWVS